MEQIDITGHIHLGERMQWISPGAAEAAEQVRKDLIEDIFNRPGSPVKWAFEGTKLYIHDISPGCALCGRGLWSCLFINGICNANCFYCPSEQKDKGLPMTSSVEFGRAEDYADYVNRFNIKGVGFSGGEPLITHDRVVDFLKTLGKEAARPHHTWMYTNGILATEDNLKSLRDSGLKEIRFDLSADSYKLDSLEKAIGIIPIVTVEIPAVPEDLDKTKQLIRDLYSAGVNYLNLHQIRCTDYNRPKLIRRGYTFVNGPGVTVLETELAALELIRYALDNNIELPVNYCSFTFRNQFQKAGARHRSARLVKKDWEDITAPGYIRTMRLEGESEKIRHIRSRFQAPEGMENDWNVSEKGDAISFSARLWPLVDFSGLSLKVSYSATALRPKPSFRYPFTEIFLNNDKKVVVERDDRHPGIRLKGDDIRHFAEAWLKPENDRTQSAVSKLSPALEEEFNRFEFFVRGLAPYH